MTEASRMTDVYHGINDRGYMKGGEGGNMDMPLLLLPAFEATWLTACTICQRGADTIKSCQTQTEIDFLCTLRENVPQSSHTHIPLSLSLSLILSFFLSSQCVRAKECNFLWMSLSRCMVRRIRSPHISCGTINNQSLYSWGNR